MRTALQAWPPSIDAKLKYVDATAENMHVEISAVRDVSWNFWHFLTRYRNRYLGEILRMALVDSGICHFL